MSELSTRTFTPSSLESAATLPMTRRQLLRTMAAGGVAVVGGAALAACGGTAANSSTVNITFFTASWPGDVLPPAADQKSSPATKAYANALTKWLKQNPGVTLKHSATNIWDNKVLIPAISAGTAPAWYMGDVLGSFNDPATKAALARGLAADLTDLVTKNNLESQLTSNYLPLFRAGAVNGRHYGTPAGYGIGHGVYYRRDLLQKYNVPEPKPGWSWEDLHTLATQMNKGKIHGSQFQSYYFIYALVSYGIASGAVPSGIGGIVPSPSTSYPWRLDLTPFISKYESLTNIWRAMSYQDKSVLMNKTFGDTDVNSAFTRGELAIMPSDISYLTNTPTATAINNAQTLAKNMNKPIDEILGLVPNPVGPDGSFGATFAGAVIGSVDPRLQRNQPALAKAYDFLIYTIIGQGAVDQIQELYQNTKDLKQVYNSMSPMSKNMVTFPGIPGTIEDAWGTQMTQSAQAIASIPHIPGITEFFPVETNTLPTQDAFTDALNGLAFTQNSVADILTKLQNTQNQQYASLTSSVSKADFMKSAKTYYAALDTFWQQNAPAYYTNDFHPWYQQTILPLIGG